MKLLERLKWRFTKKSEKVSWVKTLISHVAELELAPDECVILKKPCPSVYGNVTITGNGIPQFTYTTFDFDHQDFVKVTVTCGLPDKVNLLAELLKTDENGQNPVPVDMELGHTHKHFIPFFKLAKYLEQYFPLVKESRIPKVNTYVR